MENQMTDYQYLPGYKPMTDDETNRLWHEIPWGEATLRAYAIAIERAVLARLPKPDTAERELLELGATKPADQPGETWTVLLDPEGHPFCLTKAANWE